MKLKMISISVLGVFLSGVSSAAVSTFRMSDLTGGIGTQNGMITVPNVDATGGLVTITISTTVVTGVNSAHSQEGTTGNVPASNTSGTFEYIFGSGNEEQSAIGNSATGLANFIRLDIGFSESVVLDELIVRDIDRQNQNSNGDFIDTIWAEGDSGGVGIDYTNIGTALEDISWANTTAYRAALGSVGNVGVGDSRTQLTINSQGEIETLSLFINNSGDGTTTGSPDHGVDIFGNIQFTVNPIPEPSSLLLGVIGSMFLLRRHRRP